MDLIGGSPVISIGVVICNSSDGPTCKYPLSPQAQTRPWLSNAMEWSPPAEMAVMLDSELSMRGAVAWL